MLVIQENRPARLENFEVLIFIPPDAVDNFGFEFGLVPIDMFLPCSLGFHLGSAFFLNTQACMIMCLKVENGDHSDNRPDYKSIVSSSPLYAAKGAPQIRHDSWS